MLPYFEQFLRTLWSNIDRKRCVSLIMIIIKITFKTIKLTQIQMNVFINLWLTQMTNSDVSLSWYSVCTHHVPSEQPNQEMNPIHHDIDRT